MSDLSPCVYLAFLMTRNSKPSNSLNPAAPPFLLSSCCSQHSSVSTYINVFFTLLQCFVEPTLCQYFGVLTLEYYQSTKELDFDAQTLWCRVTFCRKWYCNSICMPYSWFIFLYIIWSDHACYLRVSAVWTHFRGNPGPITLQVADVCLIPDLKRIENSILHTCASSYAATNPAQRSMLFGLVPCMRFGLSIQQRQAGNKHRSPLRLYWNYLALFWTVMTLPFIFRLASWTPLLQWSCLTWLGRERCASRCHWT